MKRTLPFPFPWLGLRVAAHILFWPLLAVWIIQPRSPSRLYRVMLICAFGLFLCIALWPRLRRPAAAMLRRRLRVLDILLVNLLLLLTLAEVTVRVMARFHDSPLFASPDASAASRIRHHRGRPLGMHNDWQLNSLGFFDHEFQVAKAPGVMRIAALSDSFGPGVVPFEENFITLLDDKLDGARETEVYNFGVAGAAPPEYLYLFRTEARSFDPDMVLLCFFVGNDFVRRKTYSILHPERFLVFTILQRLLALRGEAPDLHQAEPDEATFTRKSFLRIERARMQICLRSPGRDVRKRYEETLSVLDEIHETTGSKLRVVIIPDEFQVNDGLYEELAGDKAGMFDRELPNRRLAGFLEERDIPFIDLLEPLREAEKKQGATYKPQDTHWSVIGNRVAAEAIADWLVSGIGPESMEL
jgi:hypothetical protein